MASREEARGWLRDVFAWQYAQLSNLLGSVAAKGFGMDPKCYQPFPGTSQTYNVSAQSSRSSLPAILAASALSGLAGAGGAAAVGALLRGEPTAAVQPAAASGEAEIRVYWGDQEILPERPAQAVTE